MTNSDQRGINPHKKNIFNSNHPSFIALIRPHGNSLSPDSLDLTLRLIFLRIELTLYDLRDNSQNMFPISIYLPNYEPELLGSS